MISWNYQRSFGWQCDFEKFEFSCHASSSYRVSVIALFLEIAWIERFLAEAVRRFELLRLLMYSICSLS